jgi:hypothetical protein
VHHEVVAEAGHRDRVELERAEPAEDREDCIRAALERARRREELPGKEKAARVLFGDLHLGTLQRDLHLRGRMVGRRHAGRRSARGAHQDRTILNVSALRSM